MSLLEPLLDQYNVRQNNRKNRSSRVFQSGFGYGINVLPYLDREDKRTINALSFDTHETVHRDKLGKILKNYHRFVTDFEHSSVLAYIEPHKFYLLEYCGILYKIKGDMDWNSHITKNNVDKIYIYIHEKRVAQIENRLIDISEDTNDFFNDDENCSNILCQNSKCSNCMISGYICGLTLNYLLFSQLQLCLIQ